MSFCICMPILRSPRVARTLKTLNPLKLSTPKPLLLLLLLACRRGNRGRGRGRGGRGRGPAAEGGEDAGQDNIERYIPTDVLQ